MAHVWTVRAPVRHGTERLEAERLVDRLWTGGVGALVLLLRVGHAG